MRELRWAAVALFCAFAAAQLVPYGRTHHNPPSHDEPPWPDPAVRALARRACFDCHSNETRWPWYAYVAPASWLVQRDVDRGRAALNFSEWGGSARESEEGAENLLEGEMPPRPYTFMHHTRRLTEAERRDLARGLDRLAAPRTRAPGADPLPVN